MATAKLNGYLLFDNIEYVIHRRQLMNIRRGNSIHLLESHASFLEFMLKDLDCGCYHIDLITKGVSEKLNQDVIKLSIIKMIEQLDANLVSLGVNNKLIRPLPPFSYIINKQEVHSIYKIER